MPTCATTLTPEMTTTEHALLLQSLSSLSGEHLYLEIGTAAGGTLCTMIDAFPQDHCPKFVVVDPMKYFPNQFETIQRNLLEHGLDPSKVDFRAASSAQAFPEAAKRGDEFDFILIDGCHRIESVTLDLKWTRLLVTGGLVCFHDYEPRSPGVVKSVNRFLGKHSNYVIENQADSLLVIRKTAPSPALEIDFSDQLYASFWSVPHRVSRKMKRWNRAA